VRLSFQSLLLFARISDSDHFEEKKPAQMLPPNRRFLLDALARGSAACAARKYGFR